MYGTRDAAPAWEREWTKTLNSIGFDSGVTKPALLEKLNASMVVHGNDFLTLGDNEAWSEIERAMNDHYTIKIRAILGASRDDAKKVRILNRYVRWNSDGWRSWIEYEPDLDTLSWSSNFWTWKVRRVCRLHQSKDWNMCWRHLHSWTRCKRDKTVAYWLRTA